MTKGYIVKQIDVGGYVSPQIRYGVFYDVDDPDHRHCKDPNANLVVWCYCEKSANDIAYILNRDESMYGL